MTVTGPTGQPLDAAYARQGSTACVELAQASGLGRLPDGRLDPMGATTRGTGELVRAVLDAGCDGIVLAIGGSATTDGGAGLLQALGARLLDRGGHDIGAGGGALAQVAGVDLSGLDPRLADCRVTLASDVDNVLLGPEGAAAVYAPQKGASPEQVAQLQGALMRWSVVLAEATGEDVAAAPGAGAAGGVGFAALAALNAQRRSGVELVLELVGFADLLDGARLVITGEGRLDEQSMHGKAPVGVASLARRYDVPVVALVGVLEVDEPMLWAAGFSAVYALASIEPDQQAAMWDAGRLLERLAEGTVVPVWLTA